MWSMIIICCKPVIMWWLQLNTVQVYVFRARNRKKNWTATLFGFWQVEQIFPCHLIFFGIWLSLWTAKYSLWPAIWQVAVSYFEPCCIQVLSRNWYFSGLHSYGFIKTIFAVPVYAFPSHFMQHLTKTIPLNYISI